MLPLTDHCTSTSPVGNGTTKTGVRDCGLRSRQDAVPNASLRPALPWAVDASHGYVRHKRPFDQKISLSSNINELDGGEAERRRGEPEIWLDATPIRALGPLHTQLSCKPRSNEIGEALLLSSEIGRSANCNRTTKTGVRDFATRFRPEAAPKASLRPASGWPIGASHGHVGHKWPYSQKRSLPSNIDELTGGGNGAGSKLSPVLLSDSR